MDGRIVLEGGRVLTVDEDTIRDRALDAADRRRAQYRTASALADQLTPYLDTACRAVVAVPYPVNRYAAPLPSGA